jgi:DNA-binding NarL/FixJ family response regulator
VADGAEAVTTYERAMREGAPFALVMMDLTVPGGMGGKETIKRLHAIDPSVKAIVLSGYSNDPIMADYESFGFSGVVPKPFELDELVSAIQSVLTGVDPSSAHPEPTEPATPGS